MAHMGKAVMMPALQNFGGWVGPLLGSLATAIVVWLYQSRKVKVEESDLILSKWKELSENHQTDMKRLRDEAHADRTRHEAEIEYVRRELKDVREEFAKFRKEAAKRDGEYLEQIRQRDEQIAGLKRSIAQNSQSTAHQIGRVRRKASETDDTVATNETNNTTDHTGIKDAIGRLEGGLGDNSRGRETDGDVGDVGA